MLQVLGSAIGDDEPLMSAGLDSLGSVEFANVLAQKLGMQMPGTLVFDYPSVRAVTDFLAGQVAKTNLGTEAAGEADLESEGEEPWSPSLGMVPGGGAHLDAQLGRSQGGLAIASVVARPMMVDFASAPVAAGTSVDKIHRVPLGRWDLDNAEMLVGDPFTFSAQASPC